MCKSLLLSVLLMCISLFVRAQESFNTSGGKANGSGGSISYSIGQVAYQTHIGTNGSVAEGVQQPYEILVVTAIEEAKGITISFTAYPNPTTDYLTLCIDGDVQVQFIASLYNTNGKLLQQTKIISNQTSIDMSNLIRATYFVKVVARAQGLVDKEYKTFKIIKK